MESWDPLSKLGKKREMSNNSLNAYSKGDKQTKVECKEERHGKEFVKAD